MCSCYGLAFISLLAMLQSHSVCIQHGFPQFRRKILQSVYIGCTMFMSLFQNDRIASVRNAMLGDLTHGRRLGELGGWPPNLRLRTVHAFVPLYFEKYCLIFREVPLLDVRQSTR